ncbi:hypothetical protein H8S17_06780 [Roseburia sp. BX1005]|uniref:AEC family transporter n=1 Tax=Roseburia zhanii TaxID=2763064 RepID=A0A923RV60_9FIRM|nr:AEC family transporter [Roseburia zhanii]MBC5713919.1 hypothetical protein [Roseburia zhanii]
MILLKQMMIFGIMMAAGYVMARKNILDEKAAKAISWLIVNIANPALILSGCIGNTISKSELLSVLTAAVVLYVILKLLMFSAIRLLVIPYIIMQIVFRITEDTMMQIVLFVVMATLAGSMVSMLAQQYDKEYLTASKVIAVTTVLSVFTMPVLSVLLKI